MSQIAKQISKAKTELIERRSNPEEEDGTLAVLFTGNWHAAFPRSLVLDVTLSPVEKITWQAIRLSITDPTRPGATPRRDELAAMVNCSGPTVTTSRAMLRICRWMTFCESVREKGRFVGDIYLFHDEPIAIASTLLVDSSYVSFLQHQTQSGSKRLRTVAASVLREIDSVNSVEQPTELEKISGRFNSLLKSQSTPNYHRSKNLSTVEKLSVVAKNSSQSGSIGALDNHSKIFAADELEELSAQIDQSKNFALEEKDHSKFFTAAKNFFPLARGSNNSNSINNNNIQARERNEAITKSETAPFERFENFNHEMDVEKTIELAIKIFPQLATPATGRACPAIARYVFIAFGMGKENQIPVISRILHKVPDPTRTYVLLQLIGRYAADTHGWNIRWLDKPIAFTRKLVDKALDNDFFPDEWALALETSIASGDDPCFHDTPELSRKKRMTIASGSFADAD